MTEEARTIRQAIKDSLDKTEDEVLIVDGKEQLCTGTLPLPFRYVITNMASILYATVAQQQGKEIDEEIIGVLSGNNLLDGIFLRVHIGNFFEWWLEREAYFDINVDDSKSRIWYFPQDMLDAWNEFIEKER